MAQAGLKGPTPILLAIPRGAVLRVCRRRLHRSQNCQNHHTDTDDPRTIPTLAPRPPLPRPSAAQAALPRRDLQQLFSTFGFPSPIRPLFVSGSTDSSATIRSHVASSHRSRSLSLSSDASSARCSAGVISTYSVFCVVRCGWSHREPQLCTHHATRRGRPHRRDGALDSPAALTDSTPPSESVR